MTGLGDSTGKHTREDLLEHITPPRRQILHSDWSGGADSFSITAARGFLSTRRADTRTIDKRKSNHRLK